MDFLRLGTPNPIDDSEFEVDWSIYPVFFGRFLLFLLLDCFLPAAPVLVSRSVSMLFSSLLLISPPLLMMAAFIFDLIGLVKGRFGKLSTDSMSLLTFSILLRQISYTVFIGFEETS